jgi:hypothetical protein
MRRCSRWVCFATLAANIHSSIANKSGAAIAKAHSSAKSSDLTCWKKLATGQTSRLKLPSTMMSAHVDETTTAAVTPMYAVSECLAVRGQNACGLVSHSRRLVADLRSALIDAAKNAGVSCLNEQSIDTALTDIRTKSFPKHHAAITALLRTPGASSDHAARWEELAMAVFCASNSEFDCDLSELVSAVKKELPHFSDYLKGTFLTGNKAVGRLSKAVSQTFWDRIPPMGIRFVAYRVYEATPFVVGYDHRLSNVDSLFAVKHGYARPMLAVDGESGSGKSQYASHGLHRLLSDGGRNVLTIVCSNGKDADLIPIENELRLLKQGNKSSYKVDRSRLACEGILRCVTKALHCDRIDLCIPPPASWTRPTLHIVIDEIALLPHFVRAIAASLKDVYGLPEFAAFESVYLVCAGTTGDMIAGDHLTFRITDPDTYTLAQFTFRESQVLGGAMRNEYIRLAEQEGNVSLTRALHHPLAVQVSSNARMLAYLHSHCHNQSKRLGLVSVEAALVSAMLEYRSTNGLAARSLAELRAIALIERRSPILSRQASRSKQRATGERCAEHGLSLSSGLVPFAETK